MNRHIRSSCNSSRIGYRARLRSDTRRIQNRRGNMTHTRRRVAVVAATALALVVAAAGAARLTAASPEASPLAKLALAGKEPQFNSPGGSATGGAGGESAELMAAMQQFDSARIAPGTVVAPGAYSAAFSSRHGRQGRRRLRRRRRR